MKDKTKKWSVSIQYGNCPNIEVIEILRNIMRKDIRNEASQCKG